MRDNRDYAELVNNLRKMQSTEYCAIASATDFPAIRIVNDAADAIEELLAAVPKWTSVEERLPEPGERVLVSNGGFVCESFLSQSGKWQRGGVDMFFMTPTHWMPLPEQPKEDAE